MKILEIFQRNFRVLGLGSHQSKQTYPLNIENVKTIFIFCSTLLLSTIYLFNGANTFLEYTFLVYEISAEVLLLVLYVICWWKNHGICIFLNDMEKTINERLEHPAAAGNYVEVILQAERWSKIIYFVLTKIVLNGIVIPIPIVCYYIFFTTDMGTDAFVLPLPVWLPFEWNSPIGFSVAIAIEHFAVGQLFFFAAVLISLEIGAYFLLMALTRNIEHDIDLTNRLANPKKNQLKVKQGLCSSIQFHSNVKQLVHGLASTFEQMLSAEFLWSIVSICGAMLMFQTQITKGTLNLVTHIIPLLFLIYSFTVVFISCELFERLTNEFENINDVIDRFEWYLFSIEVQQMLPLILIHAQKPVIVNCFGGIPCNRETFKKVTNCAFSYFMVLRRFGN